MTFQWADVVAAAKGAGIDDLRRLRKAKEKLGYLTQSEGFPAVHHWLTPEVAAQCGQLPRGELLTGHTGHTGAKRADSVASVASVASKNGPPEKVATQGSGSLLSMLSPCDICGADPVEQIRVRMDDKLSRIRNGTTDEDAIGDLLGYLILYRIATRRTPHEETP